jgi:hypothetical protein
MICKCNVDNKCMHPQHAKYSLPILAKDCSSCPLKVTGLPSPLKQISNFLTDAVAVTMSGFDKVTPAARKARLSICDSCPLYEDGRCLACGCNIKVKSEFSAEQCPLKYWQHVPSNYEDGDVLPVPEYSPETLTGHPIYAPEQMVAARNTVCDSCEYRRGRRCAGCSCNIYSLTRIRGSKCPKEKWDE